MQWPKELELDRSQVNRLGIPAHAARREIDLETVHLDRWLVLHDPRGARRGSADGVLLSRKYSEIRLPNLSGAGEAVKQLNA